MQEAYPNTIQELQVNLTVVDCFYKTKALNMVREARTGQTTCHRVKTLKQRRRSG
jgi:hypothetical protein